MDIPKVAPDSLMLEDRLAEIIEELELDTVMTYEEFEAKIDEHFNPANTETAQGKGIHDHLQKWRKRYLKNLWIKKQMERYPIVSDPDDPNVRVPITSLSKNRLKKVLALLEQGRLIVDAGTSKEKLAESPLERRRALKQAMEAQREEHKQEILTYTPTRTITRIKEVEPGQYIVMKTTSAPHKYTPKEIETIVKFLQKRKRVERDNKAKYITVVKTISMFRKELKKLEKEQRKHVEDLRLIARAQRQLKEEKKKAQNVDGIEFDEENNPVIVNDWKAINANLIKARNDYKRISKKYADANLRKADSRVKRAEKLKERLSLNQLLFEYAKRHPQISKASLASKVRGIEKAKRRRKLSSMLKRARSELKAGKFDKRELSPTWKQKTRGKKTIFQYEIKVMNDIKQEETNDTVNFNRKELPMWKQKKGKKITFGRKTAIKA